MEKNKKSECGCLKWKCENHFLKKIICFLLNIDYFTKYLGTSKKNFTFPSRLDETNQKTKKVRFITPQKNQIRRQNKEKF